MAAVIIAPHPDPAPLAPPRRPHLRPVPDLPARRPAGVTRSPRPSQAVLRRRRLLAAAATLVLLGSLLASAFAVAGALTAAPSVPAADGVAAAAPDLGSAGTSYVVQSGDTLWGIARRLHPDGDVRPLVDELAERIGGAELRPGQTIDLDGLG